MRLSMLRVENHPPPPSHTQHINEMVAKIHPHHCQVNQKYPIFLNSYTIIA
jgi:hypothetical protein